MNRSVHALDGSPGAHFRITRTPDGRFEATTTSMPGLKVVGANVQTTLARATQEFRDAVLRGEVGSAR